MTKRCGYVALIGAANAGKSTLTNALVGEPVTPITHKPHTTRTRISGIALHNETQMICIDTPGLVQSRSPLEKAMRAEAELAIEDADLRLLLIDVSRKKLHKETVRLIEHLKRLKIKTWLILNKIDRVRSDDLLPMIASLNEHGIFSETFMIAADRGKGIDDLKNALAEAMPTGDWLFPEDQLTLQTQKFLAAEVTRAAVMQHLHQELPYAIAVETETWETTEDGRLEISQLLITSEDSHKGMIIGKGGQTLKRIGETARHALNDSLQARVHLKLFVKVVPRWQEKTDMLKRFGFLEQKS